MGKYEFIYYYTFKDVVDYLKEKYSKTTVIEAIKAGIDGFSLNIPLYPFLSTSEPTVSLIALVYGEYRDWYVARSDTSSIDDDIAENFLRKFVNIYASTFERFNILYGFYQSKKANLLDDLSRVDQVKYNDTPQETNGGFDGDEHVSTLTITTSTDPVETVMKRLDEISKLFENVLKDWSERFRRLFWTEAQL